MQSVLLIFFVAILADDVTIFTLASCSANRLVLILTVHRIGCPHLVHMGFGDSGLAEFGYENPHEI